MIKVNCAVIIKNNSVLIAKRINGDDFSNKWEFPGGEVLTHENDEVCLLREINEELSIEIDIINKFKTILFFYKGKIHKFIFYLSEFKSGKVILKEHSEYKWISLDEINKYDFTCVDQKIVNKLIREKSYIFND